MRAINNNIPGLLQEMKASPEQEQRFAGVASKLPMAGGVLDVDGPLLNASIQVFGAKLGFALHYAKTGRIVPPAGGVAVRWFTNYDAITGGIPRDIFELLGPDNTLQQGQWSVGEQFSYAYAIADGKQMAVYFSSFRISFACLSWVSEDRASLSLESGKPIEIHLPGSFRKSN